MPSTSQFVATALELPVFPFPPSRKPIPVTATTCALCAGPLDTHAWPLPVALKQSAFTKRECRDPSSDAVCWPCMALRSSETWNVYVATLPEGHGKKEGKPIGWRNSSHIVTDDLHACPSRAEWRGWLMEPPKPPFVFVFAVSTQLQIIGEATIAHSRDGYPVQLDKESIWINRASYRACLQAFEALYDLGLTKDAIANGEIPNLPKYRTARAAWLPWLTTDRPLVRLVTLVSRRTEVKA